ncbi:hypothetical protein N8955_01115 [bacterium]|nr:hypothetical protein [Hellea sp.]MDA7807313.1 hypothetical protein [bacterium]MDA9047656.1 hypothetical protein [Hellea sp.]MDA9225279.1 hypothetical protein [bacterium]
MRTIHLKSDNDINLIAVTEQPGTDEIDALDHYKFTVAYTMHVSQDNDKTLEQLSLAQNISYQKINHFMTQYVDNSIWYDEIGQNMVDMHFSTAKNLLLVTPHINVTYLGNCLFRKLNALCKENVHVDGISIKDWSTNLTYSYRTDSPEEMKSILPSDEDWMGEFSMFETPWWDRDSISAYDYSCRDAEDLANIKTVLEEEGCVEVNDFKLIEDEVIRQMRHTNKAMFGDEEVKGEIIEVDFKAKSKPKKVD